MGGDGGFRIVGAVTAWEVPPVTVGMEGLIQDPDVFPQAARRLQNEVLKRVDSEGVTATGDVVQGNAAAIASLPRSLVISLRPCRMWRRSPDFREQA